MQRTASNILFLATMIHGHGLMTVPSGRAVALKMDEFSEAGWPHGDAPGATRAPCLELAPMAQTQVIGFGKSMIKMRANDGANHIGPCNVFLVDPADSSKTLKVGEMMDCMRSLTPGPGAKGNNIDAQMEIDIPSTGLPCAPEHCVLRFQWEARHLAPIIENFDTCSDVTISADGGASITTSVVAPASATTKPAETSSFRCRPASKK